MSSKLLAGRYELIEKIGEGGMAMVYKGKDRLLNRYVAIKILRPEYTNDIEFIDSFRKESQAAAGLTHPNIVGVYDVGKEGNIYYIIMEFIEGKALSDIIKERGKLDYKEAINITRQVASALSLAHKNQIVHRDVKPHNIMITNNGIAKLADFGIAKAVTAATIAGGNNKVIGSVHYFSPEQARGAYVDERSDIYSLGVVLYEMITGRVPFDGDNPVTVALMHINDPLPPIGDSVKGLPPQLEKIISKATEKYQSNRFKSADDMISALDDIEFITKVMGNKAFSKSEEQNMAENLDPEEFVKHVPMAKKGKQILSKEKKRKLEKKLNVVLIVGIIVVAIAGIIGLGYVQGWFGEDAKEIEVPDFIGKTYEEAMELAEENHLTLERGEDVYSPDQEEGFITSQTPAEGTKVAEETVITVAVSKGKKDSVVPRLIGMNYNEAKEYVKDFGFVISLVVKETNVLPEGTIIKQSVKEGTTAPKGTEIEITISDGKGKEKVKVPNLKGMSPEDAKAALKAAQLSTDGTVTYEEVEDMEENIVFWQSIQAGKKVEVGTVINYKVSKIAPVEEPEPENPNPDDKDDNSDKNTTEENDDGE